MDQFDAIRNEPICSGFGDISASRLSLYNQLKTSKMTEQVAAEDDSVPNFDLDDYDLLDRVQEARNELDDFNSKTMSLDEINQMLKQASEKMSEFSSIHRQTKDTICNQVGSVHTFSEDLMFMLNGKLPFGYEGSLKDCLHKLRTKIDESSKAFEPSESHIIKLADNMEYIFFQMNTIYSELLKKIEKYEHVMQKLSVPKPKETFTLDTVLSSE